MIEVKVNLTGFNKQMNESIKAIDAGAKEGLQEVVDLMAKDVQRNIPVAFGTARNSIRGIVRKVRNAWLGLVTSIGVARQYITYVEHGRLPGGYPPFEKIRKWLQITAKGRAFVNAIASKYSIAGEHALRAATFLKSRAIASQGTRGTKVFETALRRHRSKIEPRIRNAIRRRLAKVRR